MGGVWAILRAVSSLDELVVEAGRALGDGRRLFGASPIIGGGWVSTPALVNGRDAVAAAGGAGAAGWAGAAATGFGVANQGQQFALDRTIAADGGTPPEPTRAATYLALPCGRSSPASSSHSHRRTTGGRRDVRLRAHGGHHRRGAEKSDAGHRRSIRALRSGVGSLW